MRDFVQVGGKYGGRIFFQGEELEQEVFQRMERWTVRTEELAVELVKRKYLEEEELVRAMLAEPVSGWEAARGLGITAASFEWEDMGVFFEACEKAWQRGRLVVMLEAAMAFERMGNWLEERLEGFTSKWSPQRMVKFAGKYLPWARKSDSGPWVTYWGRRMLLTQGRMEASRLLLAKLWVTLKGERATRFEVERACGEEVERDGMRRMGKRKVVVLETRMSKPE